MKTSLLILITAVAFSGFANAQNPKNGYVAPVRKTAYKECPMTTKERVTELAVFAKGGPTRITKTKTVHNAYCPLAKGAANCPAM